MFDKIQLKGRLLVDFLDILRHILYIFTLEHSTILLIEYKGQSLGRK